MEGILKSASGVLPTSRNLIIQGQDTTLGFTVGANFTPTKSTNIGLGYRSSLDQTLEGSIYIAGSPVAPAAQGVAIKAGTTLPEIVTLSLRQDLSERFTALASVEWSHWSRVSGLNVICANNQAGNPVFCPAGNGQLVRRLELGWHDGWMFAVGGEYKYNDALTLRSGLAFEMSPVQAADERSVRVPDRDRLWASMGATYKWSDTMAFDFAYTHTFGVGDDRIDRTESGIRLVGKVDSHVDIVSASLKIKLGQDGPEPLK
jgi:long-chain fatty acid transport protein